MRLTVLSCYTPFTRYNTTGCQQVVSCKRGFKILLSMSLGHAPVQLNVYTRCCCVTGVRILGHFARIPFHFCSRLPNVKIPQLLAAGKLKGLFVRVVCIDKTTNLDTETHTHTHTRTHAHCRNKTIKAKFHYASWFEAGSS